MPLPDFELPRLEPDFDLFDALLVERDELLDFAAPDFAAVDLAELDLAEVDPVERDLVELDFAAPDFAPALLAVVVLDLEAPPADLALVDAVDLEDVLFFADPPLFAAEDLAPDDFAPADRLDDPPAFDFEAVDFDELDFDVVDFDELDLALDFGFEELVDFLVVAILGSSTFCK